MVKPFRFYRQKNNMREEISVKTLSAELISEMYGDVGGLEMQDL